jgi:hypothetical protein
MNQNPIIDSQIEEYVTKLFSQNENISPDELIRKQLNKELKKVKDTLDNKKENYDVDDFDDFLRCCAVYVTLGLHKLAPQYRKAKEVHKCPVVAIANINKKHVLEAISSQCLNIEINFISYIFMIQNLPETYSDHHPYVQTFKICDELKVNPNDDLIHVRIEFEPSETESLWRDDVMVISHMIKLFKGPKIGHCCFNDACNNEATKTCTQCREASYCSVECQRKDWPLHKSNCKKSE